MYIACCRPSALPILPFGGVDHSCSAWNPASSLHHAHVLGAWTKQHACAVIKASPCKLCEVHVQAAPAILSVNFCQPMQATSTHNASCHVAACYLQQEEMA